MQASEVEISNRHTESKTSTEDNDRSSPIYDGASTENAVLKKQTTTRSETKTLTEDDDRSSPIYDGASTENVVLKKQKNIRSVPFFPSLGASASAFPYHFSTKFSNV